VTATPATANLEALLLERLRQVQRSLGVSAVCADAGVRFADAVDSMGLVEFLALVADELGVAGAEIEQAAGRRFGTVAELASALAAAGLHPVGRSTPAETAHLKPPGVPAAWLAATAVRLPATQQPSAEVDALLGRPAGWLAEHAGIYQRGVWAAEDSLDHAARAAAECLEQASVPLGSVTALLVTSEAPPLPVGLAAALYHRLGLSPNVPALEIGGACTAWLTALWVAQRLLTPAGAVLLLAVEAPSVWLTTRPGPAGQAAALFGDGAAACVLTGSAAGPQPLELRDILLETDGALGSLLRVGRTDGGSCELAMDGPALAQRAVRGMARAVREICRRQGVTEAQLDAVAMHAGNGRMATVLARRLGLPAERLHSATAQAGNLGSASLGAAWAGCQAGRLAAWTAAGAGLQWGAALWAGPPS
jgi:3-oxoacyl-[acyl-carrier-protein] synthase-3